MRKTIIILLSISSFFLFSLHSYSATKSFSLYYSNEQALDVHRVRKVLPINKMKSDKLYILLFNQLKISPKITGLYPAVPNFITINKIEVQNDGTMIIDFDDNVSKTGSQSEESIFIKAVNMTYFDNFSNINHIYYYVNGTRLETLSHIDISAGFQRQDILK